ncbi:hypothetical protein JW796_01485 [Candidatus Dojkabacteria bacterium]|nr:hypothetical protein [Candidatus Dojkabacteria bacterium]
MARTIGIENSDPTEPAQFHEQLRSESVGGDSVNRVRKLELLHGITEVQVQTYAAAINLRTLPRDINGRITLVDAFCGTGYAAKIAVRQSLSFKIPLDIHLYDVNPAMLIVAEQEIKELAGGLGLSNYEEDGKRFINVFTHSSDLADPCVEFPKNSHGILAKMGFHEIPEDAQSILMTKMKENLANCGRLVIWEVFAPENGERGFAEVVKVKDALSGRSKLVENRAFLTEADFRSMLSNSSFGENITVRSRWQRSWSTLERYFHELDARDISLLAELNQAVIENIAPALRHEILDGFLNGYAFDVPSSIIVATA